MLHGTSFASLEQLIIEAGGVFIQCQYACAQAAAFAMAVFFGHLHSGAFGQETDGVRKREVFLFHDEVDHAAAFAAAKAVVNLLIRGNGKGTGLFAVERAQAEKVAAFFGQMNIVGYHIDNIAACDQFIQKIGWN